MRQLKTFLKSVASALIVTMSIGAVNPAIAAFSESERSKQAKAAQVNAQSAFERYAEVLDDIRATANANPYGFKFRQGDDSNARKGRADSSLGNPRAAIVQYRNELRDLERDLDKHFGDQKVRAAQKGLSSVITTREAELETQFKAKHESPRV